MATVWQQLGGTIYTGTDLGDDTLRRFKEVGGGWLAPWVYQDTNAATNRSLIAHWRGQGWKVGGVFNVFGADPETDANAIADIAMAHSLPFIMLDIEAEYQYPNPGCALMPPLLGHLRKRLPTTEIGLNTNALNDAKIWNGGKDHPEWSCWRLRIRVAPQWYSAPRYAASPWADPVQNMRWMKTNGHVDNLYDAKQKYHRAVPFSFIHPAVEPTGVEDADLGVTLTRLVEAQKLGFTSGINLFALERVPESDWALMAPYRDKLWH